MPRRNTEKIEAKMEDTTTEFKEDAPTDVKMEDISASDVKTEDDSSADDVKRSRVIPQDDYDYNRRAMKQLRDRWFRARRYHQAGQLQQSRETIQSLALCIRGLAQKDISSEQNRTLLREFKAQMVLKRIKNDEDGFFPEHVSKLGDALFAKWFIDNRYTPGPLEIEDEEDFVVDVSSSEEEEEEEEETEDWTGSANSILRDIVVYKNKIGGRGYKLSPTANKRQAQVFGSNGLKVGDWWPLQVCALRDGAHGHMMGGIAGSLDLGAYSVVMSGGSSAYEEDQDQGDVVFYSGSGNSKASSRKKEFEISDAVTAATKALIRSSMTKEPVRLLRSHKCESHYAPSRGLRYDGLYTVVTYEIRSNRDAKIYHRFRLERVPGQAPIDRLRPNREELREMNRLGMN